MYRQKLCNTLFLIYKLNFEGCSDEYSFMFYGFNTYEKLYYFVRVFAPIMVLCQFVISFTFYNKAVEGPFLTLFILNS